MSIKPTDIKLHQKSRYLEIEFDNGKRFELPCEYLRVYTLSAEAVGHAPGQENLPRRKNPLKQAAGLMTNPSIRVRSMMTT